MKISQKGLYALQALMMLARHYNQGAIRIRDIAYEEELPEKFLELILLELKNARIVESVLSGASGPQRDVVVLNAALALQIAGAAPGLAEGIEGARRSIDSGAARAKLAALVAASAV